MTLIEGVQRRISGDCHLDIFERVNLIPADLTDAISRVAKNLNPGVI